MNAICKSAALTACFGVAQACMAGSIEVNVLDKNGKPVIDAVVVLVSANSSVSASGLPMEAVIVQEKMRFSPPVSLVAVGAKVQFTNNDPWEHHVRATAAGIAQFNADSGDGLELLIDGKPQGKPAKSVIAAFNQPGAVLLGCHLHASMRGHVYVSESPWAALTGVDGVATLDAAPEGTVVIKVWHADQLIDIAPMKIVLTSEPAKATV